MKTNVQYLAGMLFIPFLLAAGGCQQSSSDKPQKYNILFIAVDDLRPELGCYGQEHVHSPNIDELASQGVQFNRAYCQSPVCGPSRVSLLTGIYTNSNQWSAEHMKGDSITLPGFLKKNGYTTLSLGKVFHIMHDSQEDWSREPWRSEEIYYGEKNWARYNTYHLWQSDSSAKHVNKGSHRGPYDEKADVPDTAYQDGKLAVEAIRRLRELKKEDKPFFLACGFWRPHLPLNAPAKYWDFYDRDEIKIAPNRFRPENLPDQCRNSREIFRYGRVRGYYNTDDFHKETRHAYYACVSYVDAQVGKLMAELEKLGMAENTIVVLWGDHGWHLGEHNFWGKHNTLENAVRTPLIVKAPGNKAGERDQLVGLIDIYPTLLDLTGLDKPAYLEGRSFLDIMRNDEAQGKQAVFSRFGGGECVVTDRYLYTEWNSQDSTVARMLFDHQEDPEENRNVAGLEEYKKVVDTHSNLLKDHRAVQQAQ